MDTKKLRQKILDLSIRGKLVPQDPNDEPASVLLERIRAEKEQLIKEGKIKRSKKSAATDKSHYENVPFEIPESWVWTSIGELFEHNTGKALNASNRDGKMMDYITTSNLYWDRFDLSVVKQMWFTEEELWRCTAKKGDLLICEGGDIGRAAIWNYDYDIRIQNHIHRLRGYKGINHRFYYFVFLLYKLSNRIGGKGVAIQGLSSGDLHKLEVPLPPEYEQIRLVKTIEKWFKFVDLLEQEQENLHTLVQSTKSKILDLAISGKLVPQDPNDEPAIELLKRIDPAFQPCDNSHYGNLPFEVPDGWCWATLGSIGKWQSGATPSRMRKDYYGGDIPWLKTGDLNDWYITDIPEYITQQALNETSVKLNPAGSILIAMYGATIGKIGILTMPATTNQACCACISHNGIEQMYLFYYLLSHKEEFVRQGGGGAQPNISKEKIVETLIPIPPLSEQLRIIKAIEAIFNQIDTITAELS